MVSGQQLKFKQASAKVRAEGIKPFTKAFGKRMKQLLKKGGSSIKKRSKKRRSNPKSRGSIAKKGSSSNRSKGSKGSKKMAGKQGVKGMTRLKKFLIGLGIGTAVSTTTQLTRIREVEFVGPIADAAVSGGVEGQLGVAIPKIIRAVALRAGFSGNGGNGAAIEGA